MQNYKQQTVKDTKLVNFLANVQSITGAKNVISKEALPSKYVNSCSATEQIPFAVLFPDTRAQIKELLSLSRKYKIQLYPISRGSNWGYGGAHPCVRDCVVLDLSRFNNILELNRELAYVRIEPGVTQQQLYDYLNLHAPDLIMDCTGASPDASVLGSILERGHGHTPIGERFENCSALEVMLADGRVIGTGFSHYSNSRASNLHRWGIGPFLDGIFTQSNFGIVLSITVWLLPRPEHTIMYTVRFPDESTFLSSIGQFRNLKLNGNIRTPLHLIHGMRILSLRMQFPYRPLSLFSYLNTIQTQKLLHKERISPWTAVGAVHGSPKEAKASIDKIKKAFQKRALFNSISKKRFLQFRQLPTVFRVLSGKSWNEVNALFGLLCGKPSSVALKGMYWRYPELKASGESHNPVVDRCGTIWCSPVVPTTTQDLSKLLSETKRICDSNGLDKNISINLTTARAACCIIGIFFNLHDVEETRRAKVCHRMMVNRFASLGYYPYRFGNDAKDFENTIFSPSDSFWNTCKEIKSVLDPDFILAPGKYGL